MIVLRDYQIAVLDVPIAAIAVLIGMKPNRTRRNRWARGERE